MSPSLAMSGFAPRNALLLLEDGYRVRGQLLGKPGTTIGKLVFNTSMTGYQETLTDPSYAGEIICFTFPLIGIYGATAADSQSGRIHARGLIVGEAQHQPDSWRCDSTLSDLLLYDGITGISGIDTRRLARHLRDHGEMLGLITSELSEDDARAALDFAPDFGQIDYVREVSCKAPYIVYPNPGPGRFGPWERHGSGLPEYNYTVAAYDFGIKRGILECLAERGCTTHVFPCTASAEELLAVHPDGLFLSNGPGDPERMDYILPHLGTLMEHVPIFGICLGHQLIARAMGLPTYRLKFGNRGANHPVLELASGKAHITSQNHSYAVALSEWAEGRPAAAATQAVKGQRSAAPPAVSSESEVPAWPPPARLEAAVADPLPQLGVPRRPLDPLQRPTAPYQHPMNPRVLVTHLNINDSSCEGLALTDKPVFSVQYHPEGCPGPRDNVYLFDRFVELMKVRAAQR